MLFVMSNRSDKPKHSASDLVCKMRDEKGVTFSQITEKEAERYLSDINNFLRIASYRKNYEKNPAGKNKGKYLNLDFAYLVDLSSIDMQLRYLILKMTIDIEHALKVRLLKNIEKDDLIGGYAVVSAFLSRNEKIVNKIGQTANSAYTSNLIAKYFTIDSKTRKITDFTDCPVWVLLEFLTFGDFLYFYRFFYEEYTKSKADFSCKMLNNIKSLRNAAAHNNCLLADLVSKTTYTSSKLAVAISKISGMNKSRLKKLSNRFVLEFSTLLFVYKDVVSGNMLKKRSLEIKNLFFHRMLRHKDYYDLNNVIKTTYNFISDLVKGWY